VPNAARNFLPSRKRRRRSWIRWLQAVPSWTRSATGWREMHHRWLRKRTESTKSRKASLTTLPVAVPSKSDKMNNAPTQWLRRFRRSVDSDPMSHCRHMSSSLSEYRDHGHMGRKMTQHAGDGHIVRFERATLRLDTAETTRCIYFLNKDAINTIRIYHGLVIFW
jgi:hypothetical protein